MSDQKENIYIGKIVFDDNNKKIKVFFGRNLFQICDCPFDPSFCHFVDFLWLLLDESSFRNMWRINCSGKN